MLHAHAIVSLQLSLTSQQSLRSGRVVTEDIAQKKVWLLRCADGDRFRRAGDSVREEICPVAGPLQDVMSSRCS